MTLKEICEELKEKVSIERYTPVERIAYGLVTLICSSVVIGLLALIIKQQ